MGAAPRNPEALSYPGSKYGQNRNVAVSCITNRPTLIPVGTAIIIDSLLRISVSCPSGVKRTESVAAVQQSLQRHITNISTSLSQEM